MQWHRPKKREPAYLPLSKDDVGRIHEATMRVFADTGFEVHNDRAFELFRTVSDKVDSSKRVIRLKESRIEELIEKTPSEIVLCGRRPELDIHLGSGRVHFGTGGTALNMLDYPQEDSRPAQMQDLIDVIRVTENLEFVHLMLLPTYPNEIPVERVDLNRFFAGLMHTDKHIMGGVYTKQGIHDVISMAEDVAGGAEALRRRPFISMITCGISPLRLDSRYGEFMIEVAESGIPVAVPAEPLCGATSPMSLAGTLVVQNCDALINVMLTQLVNPGTPVIYGCVSSTTDLRNVSYLGGPVESGMINAATAQMAQHYNIPYYATAGISDSKVIDAQCGYESAINNLLVALAGADFIHDAAGLMEFAMTVSKEKLVIDNEILGMTSRALQGIKVNEDTLGIDAIAAAGPGGNFLTSRHTRKFMRQEHYRPRLSDREQRAIWNANGARHTAERAHEEVRRILEQPIEHHLPDDLSRNLMDRFKSIEKPHYIQGAS